MDSSCKVDKRVCDQLPREIQERRKKLIPYMLQTCREDKRSSVIYDRLLINNHSYTADNPPPGSVPEMSPRQPRNPSQNQRRPQRDEPTTAPGNRSFRSHRT
ncbi:hypothetical protein DPMN_067839 [Dreissena polymorpha]|uniref:Uncharacterized protein n=1 Tax=Dreissena polymorpha TaxID=45954 RepID=A0A9D3YVZ8_DREPO|nr:hypothetical protein DPMN_067839 [Dreissena polymorpha]